MAEKKDKDSQRIKELLEIMNQNDLVELEIKHGDDKIVLKRRQPQQPVVTTVQPVLAGTSSVVPAQAESPAAEAATAAEQQDENLIEIKSPIVGTFYAKPSPDSEPCVELGSTVSPQTVVCIIEAMKVMNEIKAETDGTIIEILVKNGQAVEFGQVLFKVKPD